MKIDILKHTFAHTHIHTQGGDFPRAHFTVIEKKTKNSIVKIHHQGFHRKV